MSSRKELAQVASPGGYGTSRSGLLQVLETLQEAVSNRDDVKTGFCERKRRRGDRLELLESWSQDYWYGGTFSITGGFVSKSEAKNHTK